MLIVAFIIRTSTPLREKLQVVMKNNLSKALGLMGIIHGLSNMGGSILTPLVSSIYKDKNKVLTGVSFDYAFMASLQIIILLVIQNRNFHYSYLIGSAIAISVRYLIGKRIFSFTSEAFYQRLINGFILANALMLGFTLK